MVGEASGHVRYVRSKIVTNTELFTKNLSYSQVPSCVSAKNFSASRPSCRSVTCLFFCCC